MNHKEFSEYTHGLLDEFRIPHKMRHKMLNIRPDIKRTKIMTATKGKGGCWYQGICLECDLIFDEFIKAQHFELNKIAKGKIVPCAKCYKTIIISPYETNHENE